MADHLRQKVRTHFFFFLPPVLQISVIPPAATTSTFPDTEKADTGKHPAT